MGQIKMGENSRRYVGIDPGHDGAVAIIQDGQVRIVDMPDSFRELRDLFIDQPEESFCVYEKAYLDSSQGGKSNRTYFIGIGKIEAALEDTFSPGNVKEVSPMSWKKMFRLNAARGERKTKVQRKLDSVRAAVKIFPDLEPQLYGPKGGMKDGRAEAVLMAVYCMNVKIK